MNSNSRVVMDELARTTLEELKIFIAATDESAWNYVFSNINAHMKLVRKERDQNAARNLAIKDRVTLSDPDSGLPSTGHIVGVNRSRGQVTVILIGDRTITLPATGVQKCPPIMDFNPLLPGKRIVRQVQP